MGVYKTKNMETNVLMEIAVNLDRKIWKNGDKFNKKKIRAEDYIAWKKEVLEAIVKFKDEIEKINVKKSEG